MTEYLTPVALVIGFLGWSFVQWRLGMAKAQGEATSNWKEAYEATNVRLQQVEERLGQVEAKNRALEKENIGLTKEVNILKQVSPSEAFENKHMELLEEMKRSREDFLQHAANDQEQFTQMWQHIHTTNDIALDNNAMLKKLCKEA